MTRVKPITMHGETYREWIATDAKGRDVTIYATAAVIMSESTTWNVEIKNYTRDGLNRTIWRGVVDSVDLTSRESVDAWTKDVAVMAAEFEANHDS